MDFSFTVPGTIDLQMTGRRNRLGGVTLFRDGVEVKRKGRFRPSYPLEMPDGTTRDLKLSGGYLGLKASIDGAEVVLEPPMSAIERILVIAPLALVPLGGLIGGIIGAITVVANINIVRSGMAPRTRIGTAALNVVLAVVIWYLVATWFVSSIR